MDNLFRVELCICCMGGISQLFIFQAEGQTFTAQWGDSDMPGFDVVSSQCYLQQSVWWL